MPQAMSLQPRVTAPRAAPAAPAALREAVLPAEKAAMAD